MNALRDIGAKVLVLNAGSSSLKFKLFSINPFVSGMGGIVERIGDAGNSTLIAKGVARDTGEPRKWTDKTAAPDHVAAMETILGFLKQQVSPTIEKEVKAIGHRVVHGMEINQPVLLTEAAIEKIRQAAVLAPLHNPPGLQGISAARKVFTSVPQASEQG